jgi:MFS family permease
VASLVCRIPAGAAYRSHRGPWLVAGGCIVMAAAFTLIPLSGNPLIVGGLVALDGMGFAVATTGAMAALMERRPSGSGAGSIMGWYTGSIGAGYAVAGFVAGGLADFVGIERAFTVMAAVPFAAGVVLKVVLQSGAAGAGTSAAAPSRPAARVGLRAFTHAPALVWLAFAVSLYLNLVSGVLFTFFPLYGLGIGLSLTQIGALTGIHGAIAAAVRFGSGMLFNRISYQRSLPIMVVAGGAAVAGIAATSVFLVLAISWATIGLARGVLRVASGALVMDASGSSDSERGAASGIYLAGLDFGKVIGPIFGGISVELMGLRATFVLISVAFPAAYLLIASAIMRRARAEGPSDAERRALSNPEVDPIDY